MVLHGNKSWTSPYALSVFVTLREKGLAFDVVDVDTHGGEQRKPARHVQASLTSRVPMLVDGDVTLSESSAIVEYLEEAYPAGPTRAASSRPSSARGLARAR